MLPTITCFITRKLDWLIFEQHSKNDNPQKISVLLKLATLKSMWHEQRKILKDRYGSMCKINTKFEKANFLGLAFFWEEETC